MIERTCRKCQQVKPLEAFNRSKGGMHGRKARCRTCTTDETRARRDAQRGGPARSRRALSPDGLVRCTKCGEVRSATDFRAEPRNADGLRSQCKICDRAFARQWQQDTGQADRWRRENPDRVAQISRRSSLRRKYDMTEDDYSDLLAWQGGGCAICGSPTSRAKGWPHLVVDHCHDTGVVRGLLCNPCNTGIGGLQDDPVMVIRAARYLLRGRAVDQAILSEVKALRAELADQRQLLAAVLTVLGTLIPPGRGVVDPEPEKYQHDKSEALPPGQPPHPRRHFDDPPVPRDL